MDILEITSKDIVEFYDKYIIIRFSDKRKVISTSILNGGYSENLTSVFNHNMMNKDGTECELLDEKYENHLYLTAKKLGLNPDLSTGMGTAADMKNVSVITNKYEELSVTAIITAGIETNAGRVGDNAQYYNIIEKPKIGTINIILLINADMPQGILTRALVTCTEAKTAALQELMVGSRYSNGLATGSGTDQTVIVADAKSNLYFDSAGKHSKLGELIGKTVIAGVKEALQKQNGLNEKLQHNLLRRLRRFKVTEEFIFETYRNLYGECPSKFREKPEGCERNLGVVTLKSEQPCGSEELAHGCETGLDNLPDKDLFHKILLEISSSYPVFTYGILYIHIVDEYLWKLVDINETKKSANEIIEQLYSKLEIKDKIILNEEPDNMQNIAILLAKAIKKRISYDFYNVS